MVHAPRTRYASCGDLDIAYQVLGDGPVDLVVMPGPFIPIDSIDAEPSMYRFFRRLAAFCRVIRFDHRGMGMSSRIGADNDHPIVLGGGRSDGDGCGWLRARDDLRDGLHGDECDPARRRLPRPRQQPGDRQRRRPYPVGERLPRRNRFGRRQPVHVRGTRSGRRRPRVRCSRAGCTVGGRRRRVSSLVGPCR